MFVLLWCVSTHFNTPTHIIATYNSWFRKRNLIYYHSLDFIRNIFIIISSNPAIISLLVSAIASPWQTCQPCDVMSAYNYNSSLVDDKLTKYESRAADSGIIRYSRNELFSLRRHSGRPDLNRLASLGPLFYRRHRGGKHARERMTKPKKI